MNYQEADQLLQGRCREGRKVANNTYLSREGGAIALRLHATDIITYRADGSMVLNSGGWQTVTTKARLNDYLPRPWRVWQERGVWWLANVASGDKWQWEDGVTISGGGDVTGAERYTPDADKARRKTAAAINRYAKEFVSELLAGNVPAPGNGDCWYCLMRAGAGDIQTGVLDANGKVSHAAACGAGYSGVTLGEQNRNGDHIQSHIAEGYYVPSLLLRAIEVFPVSKVAQWTVGAVWQDQPDVAKWMEGNWSRDIAARQLQSSVARWCKRQLGFAS